MRWSVAAAGVLIGAVAVAGCLGNGSDDDALGPGLVRGEGGSVFHVDWPERALAFGDGHDHDDVAHHANLSTPNWQVVGYAPLVSQHLGHSPGGYGCSSSVEAGTRTLSITNSFTTEVALMVSDITDPAEPFLIGELILENAHIYDNVLTPDGRYAALSVSPFNDGPGIIFDPLGDGRRADGGAEGTLSVHGAGDAPGDGASTMVPAGGAAAEGPAAWAPQVAFRDACTGETQAMEGPLDLLPYTSGVLLVDLTDPAVPTVADFWPAPVFGAHSTRAYDVQEQTIIMASMSDLTAANSYWIFLEVQDSAAGAKMVPVGVFDPLDHVTRMVDDPQVGAVHDGWLQVHPLTRQVIGYFADWNLGAYIVDLDDFADPQILSHWDQRDVFGRSSFGAHGMQPIPDLWDGRHYTIGHEECGGPPEGLPTCVAWLMDTTDPAEPLTIGAWTLPLEGEWDRSLTYSLHYTGIHERTLFVSTYHGGIWAVDLSDIDHFRTDRSALSIGAWLPDRESPSPPEGTTNVIIDQLYGFLFGLAPMVMDMDVLSDGTIVTYDTMGGLYTLRFDAADPAPAPEPWPMDPYTFDDVPEA